MKYEIWGSRGGKYATVGLLDSDTLKMEAVYSYKSWYLSISPHGIPTKKTGIDITI